MYLRTTKRQNKDGSIVEYYQLAETRWDPIQRRPTAHIIYNFGRANTFWIVRRFYASPRASVACARVASTSRQR